MADWDAITRAWVADGLLNDEQRGPLLERLSALPSDAPDGPGLPIGPIVTLLVAGATWLLTGAVMTLLVLVGVDDEQVAGAIVSGCGVASLALALVGGAFLAGASLLWVLRAART